MCLRKQNTNAHHTKLRTCAHENYSYVCWIVKKVHTQEFDEPEKGTRALRVPDLYRILKSFAYIKDNYNMHSIGHKNST